MKNRIKVRQFDVPKKITVESAFLYISNGQSVVSYRGDPEEGEEAGTLTVRVGMKKGAARNIPEILYVFTPLGMGAAYLLTKDTEVSLLCTIEEEEE